MSVRGPARPRWTDGRRGRAGAGPSLRRLRRARPRPAFRGFPDGVHPLVVDSLRGAQLQALYAWSPPGGPAPVSRAQDEADAKHRRALQEWLAPLRQEYPDVEVVEELAHESPVLALARASDLSDLLVVGTCGRGGFRGLALGSVSHAPPVIHVPHGGHPVRAHDRPRRDTPAWGAQGAQSCGDRRLAVHCRRLAPPRVLG
ncbi:universal stress protein [Streptomyces sp. AK02-04a]|uniref:universal stress protein n=1 Tax=Streptomyces sp. AK02-04a TaxID=3028649 RepID=UPI0039F5CEDA